MDRPADEQKWWEKEIEDSILFDKIFSLSLMTAKQDWEDISLVYLSEYCTAVQYTCYDWSI